MVEVVEWGSGPPAVFVHGSVFDAEMAWETQRPLADGHRLRLVNRRGFGNSPDALGEDFEIDAADVAAVLGDGAHLVGHSYGAVAALLAAARRPTAVWSLTVIEPPAFALVADRRDVRAFMARIQSLVQEELSPEDFLRLFIVAVGGDPGRLPTPLPPRLAKGASLLMRGRPPSEAIIPLDELAALDCPKLVISGDHSAIFDAVCDALVSGIGAERVVLPGAGHSVPLVGEPFNEALRACWAKVPLATVRQ